MITVWPKIPLSVVKTRQKVHVSVFKSTSTTLVLGRQV